MSRVTYVNGLWQGLQVPEFADKETMYNSCPMVWEYLDSVGRDGWELVAASDQAMTHDRDVSNAINLLYLRKELLED